MSSPDGQSTDSASPHQILIVDDEEIVLVALRETLQREGYQVVTSPNAIHALSLLKEKKFSLIISDQQMPMITGLEFLAQAKQLQPRATRILITAVLSLSIVIDAINKGEIYRFVVKPWLREDLLAAIKNSIQRFELVSNNESLLEASARFQEKISTLTQQVALQAARIEELTQTAARSVQALEFSLRTLQANHPVLANEARRVYEICRVLAGVAQLSPELKELFEMAAWLHDIGLAAIPKPLIRRWELTPHLLTESERATIESHPALSQEVAVWGPNMEALRLIIRSHHENFDGTGYPDKVAGQNIPWLGRLLAVVAFYADSVHDPQTTLELMTRGIGSKFDPDAVSLFLRALPKAVVPQKQKEVSLAELRPGMVLAKGIHTSNGILLIPDGQQLTVTYIEKLRNHNRISPISESLLVYC